MSAMRVAQHEVRKHNSALNDEELMSKVRGGDLELFEELWLRHESAVRAMIYPLGGHETEDLVSEAFYITLQHLKRGGGPEHHFQAYVRTVARNLAAQHFHRYSRVVVNLEEQHLHLSCNSNPNPETVVIGRFTRQRTLEVLRRLPDRWSSVLSLRFFEEQPRQEMALNLGISANAVSALLGRALSGFREAWDRED